MAVYMEDYLPKILKPPIRIFRYKPGAPGLITDYHRHNWYEVILVEEGSVTETVGEKSVTLSRGCLVIIQPFEIHSSYALSADCSLIALLFTLSALNLDDYNKTQSKYIDIFTSNNKRVGGFLAAPYPNMEKIHKTMCKMVDEFSAIETGYEMMLKGLLYQFLSYIQRSNCLDLNKLHEQPENMIINSVCKYIEENYSMNLNVRKVASHMGYSHSYLSRLFHKSTGQNIKAFIDYVKINEAVLMLRYENIHVNEAAAKVGYENANSFSRAFKRVMGCSPSSMIPPSSNADDHNNVNI